MANVSGHFWCQLAWDIQGYCSKTALVVVVVKVSYQLKILTTALFSVALLNKRLTHLQWLSLVLLFIGVAVVQLQPTQAVTSRNSTEQSLAIGLSAVCAASIMSGFAGVYFEKLLKHTSPSIFLRNVQLGVIGVVFGTVAMYANDGSKVCSPPQFSTVDAHCITLVGLRPAVC